MTQFVFFQKEIAPTSGYIPAREVSIFAENEKPAHIEKEAMKKIRYGFQAYIVKFNNIPPEHIVINACEEAVRDKRAFALPLVTLQPAAPPTFFRLRKPQ